VGARRDVEPSREPEGTGPVRVLISADAEGVTGVTSTNEMLFGKPHYEFMRLMMTDDVNAAIAGAFDGGATEVIVNDAHWTMTNILIERLDPRADLIKGFQKHLCMVEGIQDGADAVFFVGYHARTGDSNGVGNETILGREIIEIRMNGRPVGESEINAALVGHFGSPVALATGDDAYERELRETLPEVEFGLTKYAIDRWTARCLSVERSRANIRAAAERAMQRVGRKELTPYSVDGPVELEVVFSSTAEGLMGSLVPGSERKTPRTVAYRADDIVAAWKGFFAVLLLGWSATDEVYG
jgi:D-amino peptidase